jgi:thioredoxin-dependent peroxiredoxin
MRHDLMSVPVSLMLTLGLSGVFGGVLGGFFGGFLGGCTRVLARRQHLVAGDRLAEVEGRDQDGARVTLSGFQGRPLVVYFYPRDRTTGCTIEAQAFRSEYSQFKALGVQILGVSNDDVASHRDFCTKEALPFPLLADSDQTFARAFGVRSILGLYQRITFLLDGHGVVRQVFDPVRPLGHAHEVLAAAKQLAASASR